MIVCHCQALTDRDIRAAARACGGSPDAVQQGCGAGTVCGGCTSRVERIVKSFGRREHAQPKQRTPHAI